MKTISAYIHDGRRIGTSKHLPLKSANSNRHKQARRAFITMGIFCSTLPLWAQTPVSFYPEQGATDINVDTHLTIEFDEEAAPGCKGMITVKDLTVGKVVDTIDMSIPAGPTEPQPKNPEATYTPVPYIYYNVRNVTNRNTRSGKPSGAAKEDKQRYQKTIIGGFSDAFHFYPIICHGKKATIYLHHNMLDYGHEYEVSIGKGVITGWNGVRGWKFTTKTDAPSADKSQVVVAADGSGDFSTLQGAMDWMPDSLPSESCRKTVHVKNGDYEELVYFRNKRFVTIEGESADGVVVHYPNNEVFNPHPVDIKTNELKGTFPSRRAAVAADNCSDMIFRRITFKTDCKGQAEGFLLNGERNFSEDVHVIGDGDALQANGSAYWLNCTIDGGGDTILGRGPSFFNHCTISSYGAFMWIRNTEENHGNIFNACTFHALSEHAVIARLPDNKGKNYPHAECVLLNCTLDGVPPEGFGPVAETAATAKLLEFNSHDKDGNRVDVSKRDKHVRQLDAVKDANLIGKYSDASWVMK